MIIHFLVFLSNIIIIWFLSRNNVTATDGWFTINSIVFITIYQVLAIINISRKRNLTFIINLTLSFIVFAIWAKFLYLIYHPVFIIVLIVVVLIISFLIIYHKKKFRLDLILFTFFMIFSFFLSDRYIIENYWYSNRTPWKSDLTWDEFKGKPKKESIYSAAIYPSIAWKVNSSFGTNSCVAAAFYTPDSSWTKINTDNFLLLHEQTHADIYEVWARDLRKFSDGNTLCREATIKRVRSICDSMMRIDSLYEAETEHGGIIQNQRLWSYQIKMKLAELEDYK